MWENMECATRLLVFLIFFVNISGSHAISNVRLCGYTKYENTISLAYGLVRHSSTDTNILTFNQNDRIEVFSKAAGNTPELWGGVVNGTRGYFPAQFVKELNRYETNPQHVAPTELYYDDLDHTEVADTEVEDSEGEVVEAQDVPAPESPPSSPPGSPPVGEPKSNETAHVKTSDNAVPADSDLSESVQEHEAESSPDSADQADTVDEADTADKDVNEAGMPQIMQPVPIEVTDESVDKEEGQDEVKTPANLEENERDPTEVDDEESDDDVGELPEKDMKFEEENPDDGLHRDKKPNEEVKLETEEKLSPKETDGKSAESPSEAKPSDTLPQGDDRIDEKVMQVEKTVDEAKEDEGQDDEIVTVEEDGTTTIITDGTTILEYPGGEDIIMATSLSEVDPSVELPVMASEEVAPTPTQEFLPPSVVVQDMSTSADPAPSQTEDSPQAIERPTLEADHLQPGHVQPPEPAGETTKDSPSAEEINSDPYSPGEYVSRKPLEDIEANVNQQLPLDGNLQPEEPMTKSEESKLDENNNLLVDKETSGADEKKAIDMGSQSAEEQQIDDLPLPDATVTPAPDKTEEVPPFGDIHVDDFVTTTLSPYIDDIMPNRPHAKSHIGRKIPTRGFLQNLDDSLAGLDSILRSLIEVWCTFTVQSLLEDDPISLSPPRSLILLLTLLGLLSFIVYFVLLNKWQGSRKVKDLELRKKLLLEAESWKVKVKGLTQQCNQLLEDRKSFDETLQYKNNELEVLHDRLKQCKVLQEVSDGKSLAVVEKEDGDGVSAHEGDSHGETTPPAEEKLQLAQESCTKLSKELEMSKALCEQLANEKAKSKKTYEAELTAYKAQVEGLKQDILKKESEFRKKMAAQEKKKNDNMELAATLRQSNTDLERKLAEKSQEKDLDSPEDMIRPLPTSLPPPHGLLNGPLPPPPGALPPPGDLPPPPGSLPPPPGQRCLGSPVFRRDGSPLDRHFDCRGPPYLAPDQPLPPAIQDGYLPSSYLTQQLAMGDGRPLPPDTRDSNPTYDRRYPPPGDKALSPPPVPTFSYSRGAPPTDVELRGPLPPAMDRRGPPTPDMVRRFPALGGPPPNAPRKGTSAGRVYHGLSGDSAM